MTRHTGWVTERVFFTSDLHLGHASAIGFTDRPFADVDEMDRGLVAAINDRVAPTDTLWVLGDFSFKITVGEAYALRQEINCRDVRLVTGNHDRDWASQPEPYRSCFSEVHELGHVLHLDKGTVEPPRSRNPSGAGGLLPSSACAAGLLTCAGIRKHRAALIAQKSALCRVRPQRHPSLRPLDPALELLSVALEVDRPPAR